MAKCANEKCENKAKRKYCSLQCKPEGDYQSYIRNWKVGKIKGGGIWGVSWHLKRYLREKFGNRCYRCGWHEVNPFTGLVPIEVEHIDGDWKNNREENLILLCPNCHSLTSTYRARNKGRGRHSVLKKMNKSVYGLPVA